MFGKKNKPTIDLQEDKERQERELAALEASLEFLKRPAKPAENEEQDSGDGSGSGNVSMADKARAQKFGRRMDYKTAVVKRGSNNEEGGETANEENENAAAPEKTEESAPAANEEATVIMTAEAEPEKAEEPVAEVKPEEAKEEKTVAEESPAVENTVSAESETAEKAEKEEVAEGGLIIAEAPVPVTGEEEEPKLIENPLPAPKKHVPKEMDFDLEPDADQLHFDVVDMKGKDFFDIE
ncbi:MAG: hypothetical protein K6B44_01330 [Lachnospiraceae bacterium]|nr:hypothetical protein [Lachnospiraceae bacterium]